jgi:hypothetical protein
MLNPLEIQQSLFLTTRNSLLGSGFNFPEDSDVVAIEPLLNELTDNGCAVPAGAPSAQQCVTTHLPLPLSPALETGLNAHGLSYDQRGRGFPRTLSGSTNIGAVNELSGPTFTDTIEISVLDHPIYLILAILGFLGLGSVAVRRR